MQVVAAVVHMTTITSAQVAQAVVATAAAIQLALRTMALLVQQTRVAQVVVALEQRAQAHHRLVVTVVQVL